MNAAFTAKMKGWSSVVGLGGGLGVYSWLDRKKTTSGESRALDIGRQHNNIMYRAVSDVTRDENLMRQVTERQSFKDLMTDVYRLVEEDEARQAMDDEKPIDGDKPRLLLEGPVVDVGTAGVPPPAVESCGSEDPKSQSVMHLCERCGQEAAAAYDAKGHAGDTPKPDRRTQKMLELVWIMTITMAVAAGLINVGKIAFGERLAAYAWKTVTPAFVARFVRTP